jgi:hypothetical protein
LPDFRDTYGMLPHLKTWTKVEKEAARRAFDEGSRQRGLLMQKQRRFTPEEMRARLLQTKATDPAGQKSVRA